MKALILLLSLIMPVNIYATVTASALTTSHSTTDASSYQTASISPSSDKLILIAVYSGHASATPSTPTVSGNNLTWTQIATAFQSFGGCRIRITAFRGFGSSASAGVVTIEFGGQTQLNAGWSITEFTGVDTTTNNGVVQSATSSSGGASGGSTTTLSAFASSTNATWGSWGRPDDASGTTPGSGFTELGDSVAGDTTQDVNISSEWKNSADTGVDVTWSGAQAYTAVAVEINELVYSGGITFRQRRRQ